MNDFHDAGAPPSEPEGSWSDDWRDAGIAAAPVSGAIPLDLPRLAEWLPRLGAVLWMEKTGRRRPRAQMLPGARRVVLFEHPALAVLAYCRSVAAHAVVTPHGPREWLDFRTGEGETLARLFLLPDTDCLAWDEMAAATRLTPADDNAPAWQAHAAFLRSALSRFGAAWRARVLRFEAGRLPWLRTLGARPPLRLSLIGLELVHAIVRSENAELVSPLHSG